MPDYVNLDSKSVRGAVFIAPLIDGPHSVTVSPTTIEGVSVPEYGAGQILARCFDGKFRGVTALKVVATISSLTEIPAASFEVLGNIAAGLVLKAGDRLRVGAGTTLVTITSVNSDGSLTLATAISAAIGDYIVNDPGVPYSTAAALGSSVNAVTVAAGHGARFRVGQLITIAGVSGARAITAIATDTLTFDGAAGTFTAGAQVVGAASMADYQVGLETTHTTTPDGSSMGNTMIPCTSRARLVAKNIIGASPAIRAAMPLCIFDEITIGQ